MLNQHNWIQYFYLWTITKNASVVFVSRITVVWMPKSVIFCSMDTKGCTWPASLGLLSKYLNSETCKTPLKDKLFNKKSVPPVNVRNALKWTRPRWRICGWITIFHTWSPSKTPPWDFLPKYHSRSTRRVCWHFINCSNLIPQKDISSPLPSLFPFGCAYS